ncbi:MAG: sodium:solute symporter family transporter [Cyclobacteriaceae bacterium]
MSTLDWIILFGTILLIVSYGVWKSRGSKNIEGFLLGNKRMKWWTIGLSVMATQASAITFLSTPGQAFDDGMRFIQLYFGLPIAMVILSITAIPIYYRLKVYTAYQYLESRFDIRARSLAAFLFLVSRGLAAGITIYAPSLILSTIMGWPLYYTNLIIGLLVIFYTVSGGTQAVSQTQKYQMMVMIGGMAVAGFMVLQLIPEEVGFSGAMHVAGNMGKLNLVDFSFDFENRYNIWSGIIGGLFLALSYFGTDQSQVQRYLTGTSIKESRLGLLFNGLVKIPMQFLILLVGVLVFVFYQFVQPPIFFNTAAYEQVQGSELQPQLEQLEEKHGKIFEEKRQKIYTLMDEVQTGEATEQTRKIINQLEAEQNQIEQKVTDLVKIINPDAEDEDTDYIFISFVIQYLPEGIVGLLLAVIFSAAMSSTAGELNALASTSTVDIYKRSIKKNGSDKHYLHASRWLTFLWGLLAIGFATFFSLLDNLIEAVNIIGSLFYGTILGIFLVAFYIKKIGGTSVFIAAIIAELVVATFFILNMLGVIAIGYLWYNVIGCVFVVVLSYLFHFLSPANTRQ